jgi:hypothetical protein
MRSRTLLVTVGISLCIAQSVLAQPKGGRPQVDMSARADEQFRKGREEQDRGNCQKALEHFRESHALKPGRGTLLNMGLCEKKLGQLAKALQHLEELLPQLPAGDERRQIVRDTLAEIKPKIPYLRIVLKADSPAGTVVTYDNAELEPTMIGTDIPVDPGKHVVVVEAPGLPNRKYDVVMEEGKRQTLQVEPGTTTAAASVDAPKDSSSSTKRTVGFVVGGVGVASLITGAITGGLALSDHSAAEKACPTRMGCSSETIEIANRGQTLSVVNTVALAVGVVGVAVGIPLIILGGGKSKEASTVGVWVSPDGARIGLSGRF